MGFFFIIIIIKEKKGAEQMERRMSKERNLFESEGGEGRRSMSRNDIRNFVSPLPPEERRSLDCESRSVFLLCLPPHLYPTHPRCRPWELHSSAVLRAGD